MRLDYRWLLALALVGCASEGDPLGDVDGVRSWANRSSAVGVWSRFDQIVAASEGRDPFRDPECPVVVIDGDTTTVTGGCTANDGQQWFGSAEVVRGEGETRDVTITGWGHSDDPGFVAPLDGTVAIRAGEGGARTFTVDLTRDAPFEGVTRITYEGTVDGDYRSPTTWNGSGTITVEDRSVDAVTVDEVWDQTACGGAPAAGQTTMTSELHVVDVIYDGETDCDEDKNAAWLRDGVDMGFVDGITCAAGGRGSSSLAALLALAFVVLVRRRRGR